MGSREDVAARIEQETNIRIQEMNKAVSSHKEPVSFVQRNGLRQIIKKIFSGHPGDTQTCVRYQTRNAQELP